MPVWGLILSLLIAILWAISPILMKEGMKSAGANEVNPIRSIGFFATMLLILLATQPGHMPRVTLYQFLALLINVGLSNAVGDQLYIHSIRMIGASLAVSIGCAYPLVSTFFSIWVLGEHITLLVWIGTVSIIGGLIVIQYASAAKSKSGLTDEMAVTQKSETKRMLRGFILAIAAALCWGANIPFIKYILVGSDWTPAEYYFIRSIVFLAIVWSIRAISCWRFKGGIVPLRRVSLRAWGALLAGGMVSLAVGGTLFGVCVNSLPVSIVTPITAASPFITVLLARVIHKERLTRRQIAGVTLVIIGSIAVSL